MPFVGKIERLRIFLNGMFWGIDELKDISMDDGDDDTKSEVVLTFRIHGGQARISYAFLLRWK